ncbi:uncharacterized protein LOC130813501 [Amaranthus tricolor]|uniref:uncharacterized protein LOC130813501 n=1 Tax=Amaranthus tricolor TaxID=29722 RepID=UPI00258F919D|nr:uncharacterized protein LOC130813501 [Amaranthus tricolor]
MGPSHGEMILNSPFPNPTQTQLKRQATVAAAPTTDRRPSVKSRHQDLQRFSLVCNYYVTTHFCKGESTVGVSTPPVVVEYRVRKQLWSPEVRSKERGGTLEAKSLELATELSKYRIHVACVQETRWKGQKTKGIKGYKLWYAGLDGRRNGVGILVSNDILKQLVEVRRCNDRIMLVKIVVEEEIIFFVSAYGPQVGLDKQVKCRDAGNYYSVHGGFGLGARNESGENLLEFALAKELVIANSIFRKKDEHLITCKSGGYATQVDYFLVRKGDWASCLDYKVVLGTEMPTQNRLLVLVFRMRKKIVEKKVESRGKDHMGEIQRGYGHNPVKQEKFIGLPKSVRECE